jgi:hypothetical protein
MSAIPPTATELAPCIGAKRWANRGLNPPSQTRWTGQCFHSNCGNDPGVVRSSALAGVRLRRATERSGCRNYRAISGELRAAGASTTTLSKSMSIFPSTIGLRDSISEGAYHGCCSTTPF